MSEGKSRLREMSISRELSGEIWASFWSTRRLAALTTAAVLKVGLKSSLNCICTTGGGLSNRASLAGSDDNKMACASLGTGKKNTRHTASGSAYRGKRRARLTLYRTIIR